MKLIFKAGDKKEYRRIITSADLARFPTGQVHPVYSTFAIGRDMEWASRLFILELTDDDEEGIGTSLHINHLAPAIQGEEIVATATISSLIGHELICDLEVWVGPRKIATGTTGQKILKRTKIAALLSELEKNGG